MPIISYKEQLIEQLRSVKEWDQLDGWYHKEDVIDSFRDTLCSLFLDYFQAHIEEAKECGFAYDDSFWKDALKSLNSFISSEIRKEVRLKSSWEDLEDVCLRACWIRTRIEAFNAMFGDRAGNLYTEDIVEWMQDYKDCVSSFRYIYRESIPKNAPQTHWWWHVGRREGLRN